MVGVEGERGRKILFILLSLGLITVSEALGINIVLIN